MIASLLIFGQLSQNRANQVRLFTQSRPDYFREAGIGDFNAYFRRARRMVRKDDVPAGVVLFNLLEEVMVRNTRPYIRAAYPNATIKGKPVVFPTAWQLVGQDGVAGAAAPRTTTRGAAPGRFRLARYRRELGFGVRGPGFGAKPLVVIVRHLKVGRHSPNPEPRTSNPAFFGNAPWPGAPSAR